MADPLIETLLTQIMTEIKNKNLKPETVEEISGVHSSVVCGIINHNSTVIEALRADELLALCAALGVQIKL